MNMKKTILTLVTVLTLASCGSTPTDTTVKVDTVKTCSAPKVDTIKKDSIKVKLDTIKKK